MPETDASQSSSASATVLARAVWAREDWNSPIRLADGRATRFVIPEGVERTRRPQRTPRTETTPPRPIMREHGAENRIRGSSGAWRPNEDRESRHTGENETRAVPAAAAPPVGASRSSAKNSAPPPRKQSGPKTSKSPNARATTKSSGEKAKMTMIKVQRPHVDPSLCIGCGACEKVCPDRRQARRVRDERGRGRVRRRTSSCSKTLATRKARS